jgi:hypothetical protein
MRMEAIAVGTNPPHEVCSKQRSSMRDAILYILLPSIAGAQLNGPGGA